VDVDDRRSNAAPAQHAARNSREHEQNGKYGRPIFGIGRRACRCLLQPPALHFSRRSRVHRRLLWGFRGRVLLVSVSNVGGSKWWVYEIMDSGDLPARQASSWAWRVVLSGVLLIVIFGVITWKLALYWLKPEERP